MPSINNMNSNKKYDEYDDEEYDEPEIDYEEIRKRRERSDLVSKQLGELLLKGYKMLDEICEPCGCVLMQLRNEPKFCVGCKDKTVAPVVAPPTAVASALIDEPQAAPVSEVKRQKRDDDEVAKKLSELLLKGYKMLNATCEKCNCIMMQKRNENAFCVSCEEADKAAKVVQQSSSAITTRPIETTIPQVQNYQYGSGSVKLTLIEKIQWANSELKKSTTPSHTSIELCDLIKSAANALAALEQLKQEF